MENRADDFEPPLYEIGKSVAQVEKRLEMQLKPAAQWFKHIDCLSNELDDTISILFNSSKEPTNFKPYKQTSKRSVILPPSHQPAAEQSVVEKSVVEKPVVKRLAPTIAQFQDFASKAQKELYKLKSQIQKDAPKTNLRQP